MTYQEILEYIPVFIQKYENKFVVSEGDIKYIPNNLTQEEIKWCQDLGIEPYNINLVMNIKIGDEIPGFSQEYFNEGLTSTPDAYKMGYATNDTITQDNNLKWYVMKIEGDNVTLVGKPTGDYIYLDKNVSYLYGADEFNRICSELYSIRDNNNNILYQARNINEADVLYLSEYNPSEYTDYGKTLAQIGSDDINNKYYPYDDNGTAQWNDWTVEGDDYEYQTKYTYYNFRKSKLVSADNTEEQETKIDLLFGENEDYNYWIANTCIYTGGGVTCYRMFYVKPGMLNACNLCSSSKGNGDLAYNSSNVNHSIRPVITVPYDIVETFLSEG